ncbi:sulfotransferase family protein [Desulfonatronovibrio magnus]|uniref:sulfotransferase family protein n=1 Tax=Desulfonatronovibrio magnus TaxID=698827 RepID=UPI0005EB566E|nr:sulfotransferase [Desulfonatronovibrio magnus]
MDDNSDAGKPIFIVGTPRSGTTLTAKILGRHSRLFMPGETHFFEDIWARRKDLGSKFDQSCRLKILERLKTLYARYNEPDDQALVEALLGNTQLCNNIIKRWNSYKDVFSTFMEMQMLHEGQKRWGNNTPKDIFYVQTIIEFFPQAKILVCVRDVRDFLLSYQGKWRATAPEEVERLKKLYHPLITSLLWKSSVNLLPGIKNIVAQENLHIIRYEDLVTEPENTMREVCVKIGEEFEQEMLDVGTYGSAYGDKGKGIFATSVGRWKTQLSKEETWIAQKICRTEMDYLGYEMAQTKKNYLRVLGLYTSAPIALFRGLYANRHKRGPFIPYLARRLMLFR